MTPYAVMKLGAGLMLGAAIGFAAEPEEPKVVLGEMLPDELAARVKARPIAVVPMGSIEYHGVQCAFCVDMSQAEIACREAVRQKGGVCLNGVCWGSYEGSAHRLFPGSIMVRTAVLRDLMIDIIESLRMSGFRAVLCVSGHIPSGQVEALRQVRERYEKDPSITVEMTNIGELASKFKVAEKYGVQRGVWDHGAANETSNLMASKGNRADLNKLPPADSDLPFVSVQGLDPHLATAEYGDRALKAITEAVALETDELLAKALAKPLPEKKPATLKISIKTGPVLSQYAKGNRKNLFLLINGGIQKMVPIQKGKTEYVVDDLWDGRWGVNIWHLSADTNGVYRSGGLIYAEIDLKEGENKLDF